MAKICQFTLKILSRNKILTTIKGHNAVTGKNPNLDLVNINAFIKFGKILSMAKICQFTLKILSRNKILTTIKGHNAVTGKIPNLDLVNINAFIKFGKILSICSKDIERKRNSNINQGS